MHNRTMYNINAFHPNWTSSYKIHSPRNISTIVRALAHESWSQNIPISLWWCEPFIPKYKFFFWSCVYVGWTSSEETNPLFCCSISIIVTNILYSFGNNSLRPRSSKATESSLIHSPSPTHNFVHGWYTIRLRWMSCGRCIQYINNNSVHCNKT